MIAILPPGDMQAEIATEVLIIGAGAGGLVAALAARAQGREVIVLERDPTPSGSTALSSGFIPAAGTAFQRAIGVDDDTPGLLSADILAKSHQLGDPAEALRVASAIGPALEWLATAHGMPFEVLQGFRYPGHSRLRMHAVPEHTGAGLMARLLAAAEAADVQIVPNALATTLFADETGRIHGVRFQRPDGNTEDVGCDRLILACNGYGGAPELVRRLIPEMQDALYFGHAGNQGDALRWGEALGAQPMDLGAYQGHGAVAHPHGVLITWALMMEGGVQINTLGRRFWNEHEGYSEAAVAVLGQPGGVVWNVYDARLHALGMTFPDYRGAEAMGAVRRAETVAELAAVLSLPEAALAETLAEVAALAAHGGTDRFGRGFTAPALQPPYHAVRVTGALFHTQGGLRVDAQARLLRADGTPLPNLCAVGGAARGVSGPAVWGYLSGNGLLTAVAYGWLAGRVDMAEPETAWPQRTTAHSTAAREETAAQVKAPSPPSTDAAVARRVAALRWQIENNRAAFDQQAHLPMQLEFLRDLLLGLRRTRVWRLIKLLRRIKQRLRGRITPDPLETALAALSAASRLKTRPDVRKLLHPEHDYATWIATTEPGLQAQLLGANPGRVPLAMAVPGPNLPADLATVTTPWTVLLAPSCHLAPDAEAIIAASLADNAAVDLLYTDADTRDAAGQRHSPDFRPDWDPDQHLGRDLLAGLLVCRTDLLRTPGLLDDLPEEATLFALSLRLADQASAERIRHIPAVLCHMDTQPDRREARRAAAQRHLGDAATVTVVPHGLRIQPYLPAILPRVSLIIPTRDRPDLLGPCLDGLLTGTDYPDLELVLIDNGSTDPAALALLTQAAQDPRVRVIRDDGAFNWSRLNNVGAAAATGAVLVLLNNDTAMPDPHWLTELVRHVLRPEIGAVGPMLLYPDGRIQHAGIAIDDHGNARHLFRLRHGSDPGPNGLLGVVRSVSGVTGACLAVRRDVYQEAGGPTEALAVACNDVDFCLRLQALGYRNLWTPFAVVEHRELASRGADASPERHARAVREILRLRREWGGGLHREPGVNANLIIVDEELWLRGA